MTGWDLCKVPKHAYPERVHEFYANLPKTETKKSWVRGHEIEYNPVTINRLFHILIPREAPPACRLTNLMLF